MYENLCEGKLCFNVPFYFFQFLLKAQKLILLRVSLNCIICFFCLFSFCRSKESPRINHRPNIHWTSMATRYLEANISPTKVFDLPPNLFFFAKLWCEHFLPNKTSFPLYMLPSKFLKLKGCYSCLSLFIFYTCFFIQHFN